MGFTDSFRRQHEDILDTAKEISSFFDHDKLKSEPDSVVSLLNKLSGKLSAHLTMEDKVLYPKLYSHPKEEVRLKAKSYFNEMGGLSQAFLDYYNKWQDAQAIETKPQEFIDETSFVFDALSKRIDREDNDLYVVADD